MYIVTWNVLKLISTTFIMKTKHKVSHISTTEIGFELTLHWTRITLSTSINPYDSHKSNISPRNTHQTVCISQYPPYTTTNHQLPPTILILTHTLHYLIPTDKQSLTSNHQPPTIEKKKSFFFIQLFSHPNLINLWSFNSYFRDHFWLF